MTPSKFASNPIVVFKNSGFLLLTSFLFLFFGLVGCQTGPKNSDLLFLKGKAQVIDKKKSKEDYVSFTSTVQSPDRLRMDIAYGLLGIGLGTLTINEEKAVLLNGVEHKAYVTEDGTRLLTKLMKTEISPRDVIAIFAEKFPLKGWYCNPPEEKKAHCNKGDVTFDWEVTSDGRRLNLESPRSQVIFVYKTVDSGKTEFDLKIPSNYSKIEM